MSDEQKRPYYISKSPPPPPQPKSKQQPANVVPVADWVVAQVLFWRKDSKKKS